MVKSYTEIYPEEFFSITTPTSPWFNIQFRTKVSYGANIETEDIWQSLNTTQNTFVKEINIEDNGGVKKLTLTLFDKNFSYIENLVMGSLFITRASNDLLNEEIQTIEKDQLKLNYVFSNQNLINVRIRIGYADYNTKDYDGGSTYFETTSAGDEFEQRLNMNTTTIRSPWFYFMINGINNEITENGLQMTINGLSLTSNALTKLKFVQQFAKIVGKPKELIDQFREIFNSIPNSEIKINDWGNGSEEPYVKDSKEEIELFLGGEAIVDKTSGKIIIMYKTIAEIFSDLCSKINPLIVDGGSIYSTSDSNSDNSENKIYYNYLIKADGTISFFYPNPEGSNQIIKRIYTWREHPQTLIKSFNIQTTTDFAIMSQKLLLKGVTEGMKEFDLISKKTENISGNQVDININLGVAKTYEGYNAALSNDFSFVNDIIDFKQTNESSVKDTYKNQLKNLFIRNINRQVFKGSITIAGDPFYFFDNKVRPFEFIIKINVLRPNDNVAEKSYFSGDYVITNIKHIVGENGYETILDVMRWPSKEETYTATM